MAVHKSKRNISRFEFEHTFTKFYDYSCSRTSTIAKRRRKWLGYKIENIMNTAFDYIMQTSIRISRRGYPLMTKTELLQRALSLLGDLQKALWVLWNVDVYPMKRMIRWSVFANDAIKMLKYEIQKDDAAFASDVEEIMILDWEKIRKVAFLDNMSKLHRFTHGKAIHAQNKYDGSTTSILIDLVDEAFYQIICANAKIPKTQQEYKRRQDRLNKAIICLREMNRPLLSYFNTQHYSENVMREWSDMLQQEIKMLIALQKSDKSRFKALP